MEDEVTDGQSQDDPGYWDNIVQELLEIENGPTEKRSREPSITITSTDAPVIEEDQTEHQEENPVLSDVFLDRPYIYEDPDSEALLSENNSEYVPHGDSDNDDLRNDSVNQKPDEVDLSSSQDIPSDCINHTSALCETINNGDMEGVDSFIERHREEISDICIAYEDGGTSPVTAAACLGSVDVLEKLSEAGVWLSCTDGEGKLAIHRAVENGHNNVIEWLVKQGQWTGHTKDGMSSLHLAAEQGNTEAMTILLEVSPNVDEETSNRGNTSLDIAVQKGHIDMVELLLGRGAYANHIDKQHKTVLYKAAEYGLTKMTDLLLKYDAKINLRMTSSGKTPLHIAVENNHYQVIVRLLEGDADVDIKDKLGETVLHKLHQSDLPVDAMDLICQKSKDIDAKNKKGRSALFAAAEHGNIDGTLILIQHHADVNFEIPTGNTPLYAATHYGHWDLVDKLLLAGANVNKATDNGTTALYKAARNDQLHIVALLLCSGAKVNQIRKTGWGPLHVAVHHANDTIVEQLIAAGADCNLTDNIGQSPLAIAAYMANESTVKLLLNHCRDPVAYYLVAKLGNTDILKFLIECSADFEITNRSFGWRAIHYAAQDGHSSAVATLAIANVDIDAQDSDGNTALHMAILHKHLGASKVLLEHKCFMNTTNKKGESSMSLAAQTGNIHIVRLLIFHGARIDMPDTDGMRPLVHAIKRNHTEIASLLISYGACTNEYEDDPSAITPVWHVCRYGNLKLLKTLAERGVSMEQRDEHNNSLLHVAAKHGHLDVVFELITIRASLVNTENSMGKKPLHLAATEGHPMVVETLLSAGTKVSIMDDDETVLYEMAKHQSVWEILKQWADSDPSMLEPPLPGSSSVETYLTMI